MDVPPDALALADWRRRTAELYRSIRRQAARGDPEGARTRFQRERDRLFRDHPASPIDAASRSRFAGLRYAPYQPSWRVVGRVDSAVAQASHGLPAGRDGTAHLVRVGRVDFTCPAGDAALSLFWIAGYGGGLFLAFSDSTNGDATFGGGRYLFDTIKGADLGAGPDELTLDFNFAYNPSCAYDARWTCPLPPAENRLDLAVPVGELVPHP